METNETQTPTPTENIKPVEGGDNVKPLSLIEEVRKIRDETFKARDELREERTKLEQIQADNLLGSSAGGHIEAKPPVEDTPQEYARKAMSGEIGDGKT